MRKLINILNEATMTEAFDKASPWTKNSNFQGIEYAFSVEGHDYDASFFPHDMAIEANVAWGFCFSYVGENGGTTKSPVHANLGHMGKSASRVFATVGAILLDFVTQHQPSQVDFTGDKKNGRADFYEILLRHLSARIEAAGYTFSRNDGEFSFTKRELNENEILDEMPMASITKHGDWDKNSSFKDQDRKLLNNPKAITKIQAMWKYPEEVDYNVMLVNNKEANLHTEVGDIGDKNAATKWLQDNMPKTAEELIANLRADQVNIIFTNNKGTERVPMTGWIMAHRFGHAVFRTAYGKQSYYYQESATILSRYLGELAQQYGIPLNGIGYGSRTQNALFSTTTRNLMSAICTFKSARDGNLRNTMEALHELFAQYIMLGEVRFNDIPRSVKVGRSNYGYRGGDDYDSDNHMIQSDLPMELDATLATAIHHAVGHVYVM
jgi:hypothetical protein